MRILLLILFPVITLGQNWQPIGNNNPALGVRAKWKLDADSGVLSMGIPVLTEVHFDSLINYIDSITNEISQTKLLTINVVSNSNTVYDPEFEGAEILNIDRNGFNESDFFQQPNWMLYFPDGVFAGERLNILYNTKTGFGGGGGSPGGFTYPFVWIGTATGNIVTLPTNINFILTVDVGSITLIPSEYSYIDNQITIDNSIDLSTLIRVIYW